MPSICRLVSIPALTLVLLAPAALASVIPAGPTTGGTRGKATAPSRGQTPQKAVDLGAVTVNDAPETARNGLSASTGSSQYTLGRQAIQKLPLGAATPMNQVLLQAPGVVQDVHGGLHVRGDHGNLQYRVDGVVIPESISGFGQTLDARMLQSVSLLDGALPAKYGERTAAVVEITTRRHRGNAHGGSVGVTAGSFGTLSPDASAWGQSGRWSYFGTASYMQNNVGIENPTPSRAPIHDRTHQVRGFADIGYQWDTDTRISLLAGVSNNRFQIPNRPGLTPVYAYFGQTGFDSANLGERQNEVTRFGVLSYRSRWGRTDVQLSLGQRQSSLDYLPDPVGDLMFNGVASTVARGNRASTLQADFSVPVGDAHMLSYGLYGQVERGTSRNDARVFPADAAGHPTSSVPIAIVDSSRLLARTWAAYVQDEWSISDALTANIGVRGDIYTAAAHESQLSPRLGLVYQAGDSTVLHAGYARYFTPPSTEQITAANLAAFAGTTNAQRDNGNNAPLTQRSDYLDVGVAQSIGSAWTMGLDAYDRRIKRLQDEGQFGAALVYSTFNFADGRIRGVEYTVNYADGPLSAYFNLATGSARGRRVITSQYNFDPTDLAYIADHYIYLDHDQAVTSSGGINLSLADGSRMGANYLYGSGLRRDGAVPNGASMPAYFQLNLSVAHDLTVGRADTVHLQLALINALDRVYELRDGTGIGVGAPQYGPRRGVYLSARMDF